MATRLVTLLAGAAFGLAVTGSSAAQTVPAPVSPVLVPAAALVDSVGELLRVFEEGKEAAEKIEPPEVILGTAFDPQAEYR